MTLPLHCHQYVQTQYGQFLQNNNESNININNNNNSSECQCQCCHDSNNLINLSMATSVYTNYMANHHIPTPNRRQMSVSSVYQHKTIQTEPDTPNTNVTARDNMQDLDLPSYQSRQNKMISILHKYETLPKVLVAGFIRELDVYAGYAYSYIIPNDLINLCFKFYQHCDTASLIDSKSCDELYTISWEATENEEYLFADQIIEYLLSTNMEDASTTNLMAVVKYFMKDYALSEKYFSIAAAIDPSCDIIMNNYAVLLLEEGRFGDAQKQICSAIACNPQCIKNHQQYAYILYSMGKYEQAAKECELMILLEPNIESYSGYAWLLEAMGQFDQSAKQYVQLIKLQPNNAIWYYWYAVLLQRCTKYALSMVNFEKCLALSAEPPTAAHHEGANGNYAYSLYLNEEYENAYKYIQIALKQQTDSKHLCVHYYYALIMIQSDKIQTAINELYLCLDLANNHLCQHEKGCLNIHVNEIHNLLSELGY